MIRSAANIRPCRAANSQATCDSMSTAAAPVARRVAALSVGVSSGASTPAMSARLLRMPPARERRRELIGKRRMRRPARSAGDDAGRDDHVTGGKARIEAAGDPEAQHRPAAGHAPLRKQPPQPAGVAARRDGDEPRPLGEAHLLRQPRHHQDREPLGRNVQRHSIPYIP